MTSVQVAWFIDTSALVTLAISPGLNQAVQTALTQPPHRALLMLAVRNELDGLVQKNEQPVANWAAGALTQLAWLGKPLEMSPADETRADELQKIIAGGRALTHPQQHYGEAAIIATATRATLVKTAMLSDDYGARIEAKNHGLTTASVHKLIHLLIRNNVITAQTGWQFAEALHKAGRAQDYSIDELQDGKLGRVGRP
ncbi:MAG: hypothetical protein WCP28_08755 [Actinomycetes bacterium]